jgi:hypothetical protein
MNRLSTRAGLLRVNRISTRVRCTARATGTRQPLVDSTLWQILQRGVCLGPTGNVSEESFPVLVGSGESAWRAERLAVLRIAQSWFALADRAARGTDFVPDQGSGASSGDAAFTDSELSPAIPL